MNKTVAFIFARGGSKGLPGKNLKSLAGKPLIAHSIEFALSCPEISDVVVSTDSPDIAAIAKKFGATVPFMRPSELSHDTAPEMAAWQHAAEFYRNNIDSFECFLSLPTVSPLRITTDIPALLKKLSGTKADFIMSATESEANPYANLIEHKGSDGFKLCMAPKSGRRQDAPKVFRIIPMYYACPIESVFRFNNLFEGRVEIYEIPRERSVDVDTPEDFRLLEFMHSNLR